MFHFWGWAFKGKSDEVSAGLSRLHFGEKEELQKAVSKRLFLHGLHTVIERVGNSVNMEILCGRVAIL